MSVGFIIGSTSYVVPVTDDGLSDARAELVDLAKFAGTGKSALDFVQRQCLSGYSATNLSGHGAVPAPNLLEGITVVPSPVKTGPADDFIDFDNLSLHYDGHTFDLEWLARGGSVDLPDFARDLVKYYSYGVADGSIDSGLVYETSITDGTDEGEVNVVSSKHKKGKSKSRKHKPLIDIDFPAALIPSSTPGHFHLYLDKDMDEEQYMSFLLTLRSHEIIADGNVNQMGNHGATFLRLPWVKKQDLEDGPEENTPSDFLDSLDQILMNASPNIMHRELKALQEAVNLSGKPSNVFFVVPATGSNWAYDNKLDTYCFVSNPSAKVMEKMLGTVVSSTSVKSLAEGVDTGPAVC